MKYIARIIFLVCLLIAMNWIYSEKELTRFLIRNADQALQAQKIAVCDVIYISESSNFSPDNSNDKDRRKLSQFIADFYPTLQFEAINKPAAHAGVYRNLLSIIPDDNTIQTVIVAVNLRSFGASWIHSSLETALNKSNVMYNNRPPLLNRFLISLNAYDNRSEEERSQMMLSQWRQSSLPYPEPMNSVENWTRVEKWGDWKNPKRQLADHFIKQYAFLINEDNPRVKDLDAIVELATENGWNLVFHLLAEDIEGAKNLVGDELSALMLKNANWLSDRYEKSEVNVVNNVDVLPSENFAEKDFPSEHYDEAGRKKLAMILAFNLRNHHSEQYVNATWATNNFEQ